MIVRKTLFPGEKPTEEQIIRIKEAAKYPIVYDEDSPETTPEQANKFYRVHPTKKTVNE